MFIGFIAVIVVLLIIVAVMSTGTTTGSGGVDQTKAAKMVTEMSALAQTSGFFKTTQNTNDFSGVTVQKLIDAGIVSSDDVEPDVTAADYTTEDLAISDNDDLIKSKAVEGLYYNITPTTDSRGIVVAAISGENTGTAIIPANTTLAAALEQSYLKFTGSASGVIATTVEGAVAPTADVAGLANVVFK